MKKTYGLFWIAVCAFLYPTNTMATRILQKNMATKQLCHDWTDGLVAVKEESCASSRAKNHAQKAITLLTLRDKNGKLSEKDQFNLEAAINQIHRCYNEKNRNYIQKFDARFSETKWKQCLRIGFFSTAQTRIATEPARKAYEEKREAKAEKRKKGTTED